MNAILNNPLEVLLNTFKLIIIEKRNRIYAAQMKRYASYGGEFIINDERIRNPRWIELYKANWNPVYKSVRTPCSCWMCRGEEYNRCAFKKETVRIINECTK